MSSFAPWDVTKISSLSLLDLTKKMFLIPLGLNENTVKVMSKMVTKTKKKKENEAKGSGRTGELKK